MFTADDAVDRWGVLTRRRLSIVGTLLVVAALLVALRGIEFDRVVAELLAADPRLIAAAAVVYAASWPLRGRRYGDVLATTGHPLGTGFLMLTVFLSQTANLVVPARGGDAVRAYVLQARREVPYSAGFASLAVERGFDLAAIAVLGSAATGWLVVADPTALSTVVAGEARPALLAAGGVAAATLLAGGVTLLVANTDRSLGGRLLAAVDDYPRLQRPASAVVDFAGDIAVVARNPRALLTIGGGSLVIWALDVATAVLVLAALHSGLAAGPLLAVGTLAVSVGNLAKILPLSQGGVGLYEAAFTGIVVALSPTTAGLALAAAIVDHALKNAVTLAGGAVAAATLGVSPSTAARRGADSTDDAESAVTNANSPTATTADPRPDGGDEACGTDD